MATVSTIVFAVVQAIPPDGQLVSGQLDIAGVAAGPHLLSWRWPVSL